MEFRVIDNRSRGAGGLWIAAALILAFALSCIWFATRQDIWIDESTQLSGITLSPLALIHWLAGTDAQRFGVPGDRMPPLGYLLDWAWWHGVSQSVLAFRLFHAALVVAALALFARTERRYVGGRWAFVGLIFLAVSPETVQLAVELRAYPMLFALACVQAALFLRLVAMPRPTRPALAGFALVCVVTYFVHFFGVVATCAYFGALLLRFLRASPFRVIVAGLVALVPALALQPFIMGASALSAVPVVGTGPVDYILQLFAGSVYLVVPLAGALFLAGSFALFGIGLWTALGRVMARRTEPVDHMIVVAGLGVVATVAPHFWIHSFDTLKPSYSIWLLPVLALIIGSGARQAMQRDRWIARAIQAAIVAMAAGATVSGIVFLVHSDWYVHGPARAIAAERRGDMPIVYVGTDTYAYGYFPTVYLTQRSAEQWLAEESGVRRLPDGPIMPWSALSRYKEALVVDIRVRRYSDLGQCLKGRCPPFERSPLLDAMLANGGWHEAATTRRFGYYDVQLTTLTSVAR
ncbi:hypothetical protein ASG11_07945 [Sphingomonas sp. Leaf357]|uniref:hypothetical protein n=1 Tax=Sphingomonas sp. Leaf357 TaxID=1736350 RepID=UPI0006F1DA37|nr:hypothetical protein [Sphingomonas sp. Leaf357]KQS04191.1 hypothetical protein ASG11_07945 [Sphingomonas sp. Leaf357]